MSAQDGRLTRQYNTFALFAWNELRNSTLTVKKTSIFNIMDKIAEFNII